MAAPRLNASSSTKGSAVSTSSFQAADIIFFISADQQAPETFVQQASNLPPLRAFLRQIPPRGLREQLVGTDPAARYRLPPRHPELFHDRFGVVADLGNRSFDLGSRFFETLAPMTREILAG